MQRLFGLLVFFLSLLVHVYPVPITSNSTTNGTILQNENNKCYGKDCPDGKTCIVDESASEGYKCCKNKKCAKMKCKDPGEVENATRYPKDPRKFNPNETVIYDCKNGYSGRRSFIKCLGDGTWSIPKPTCIGTEKDIIKLVTTPMTESTSIPESQPSNVVLIVVIFLLLLSLIGIAGAVFFRYKNRNNRYMGCRQRSHPVVLENVTFPTMPDKLEEGAISVNEFAQYVALGHGNADQKFREEFEQIQNQSIGALTWETSLLQENQDKNRYINIVAYDHSRVRLKPSSSHRGSGAHHSTDYINGNYVSSYEKPKAYIACQGPMPNTYNEFWRMIWENNVTVIVMITNLVENGRRKCDQYWPREGREQYKHISVTLRDVDVYANYTVRSFQIRNTKQSRGRTRNNERRILQFHYTQWPDHGTPEYILPLLSFIRRSTIANVEESPIVVHCSAGVGRTGAYIMLHSMIQMARAEGKLNINKFLRFIRIQRNYLVQTEDQYIFLHDALLCHFSCGNTECPAQQLKMYVENLLAPPVPCIDSSAKKNTEPLKESGNGVLASAKKEELIKMSPGKNRNGMQRQFMIVAHYVRRDIDYDFALRSVNQHKNRPNGVLPIFRSRVPLHYRAGVEGSEYINASFLQGYRNGRMFIVTQLPLQNTRKDFWQLVWDHNCSIVVTIRSKEWNEMTDKFWPGQDHHMTCSAFNVSFSSEKKSTADDDIGLTVRDFVLEATKDDYVLAVKQLDISNWPSIDELNSSFVSLLNTIVRHTERKDSSIIIQDRYGGTPAGQLACIHSLHQQLSNENVVDVFQTARVAYQMRPGIFSTHADLHFIYKAMLLEANPSMFRTVEAKSDKEKASTSNGKSLFVQEESSADTKPLLDKSDDTSCKTEEIPSVENKLDIQNKAEDVECVLLENGDKKDESFSNETVTEEAKTESESLSPTVDFFKDMNDSVASESALLLKS